MNRANDRSCSGLNPVRYGKPHDFSSDISPGWAVMPAVVDKDNGLERDYARQGAFRVLA